MMENWKLSCRHWYTEVRIRIEGSETVTWKMYEEWRVYFFIVVEVYVLFVCSSRKKGRNKYEKKSNDAGTLVSTGKRGGWCFCYRHGRFTL